MSNNKNLTKEIQEQREIEKIQIEEQKLLAHKEKYKKMITLLELSDNEIKKSICDSNYLSKLQNDLIDFEFAINVLGYNKDETLEELRTTTGSNKDRPILEVRRIFSWAWDIYRMTTDDCLVIFNDSNQRNRFIDEYYAFCDAYQAGLADQYRSFFEPNIQVSTASNNTGNNNIDLQSNEEFIGIDGKEYTKNRYGFICRKGSTQIIGQNGCDFEGHRLEPYSNTY